jgi:hypothetical protein
VLDLFNRGCPSGQHNFEAESPPLKPYGRFLHEHHDKIFKYRTPYSIHEVEQPFKDRTPILLGGKIRSLPLGLASPGGQ